MACGSAAKDLVVEMPHRSVFLSHSRGDKPFVDRLASDLERLNVDVWYDKWEISVGDSLIDKISEGIQENDYLAIVLSPRSVGSEWVKRELNAALMRELAERKVVVLPILLEDCEIPILLREKKWADFRTSYDQGFEELLLATSPLSPTAIKDSKNFRTAQYLVAGLSATDDNGTNTLNHAQIRRIYPFRNELRAFTGREERRLLFWSAAAFRAANPNTPAYMSMTTPTWALTAGLETRDYAQWIIDGLPGPLFDHLIQHYRWAKSVISSFPSDTVKRAFLMRQAKQSELPVSMGPVTPDAMRSFLSILAADDPPMFKEHFLANANESSPIQSIVIESSSHLDMPPDESFYFSFLNGAEHLAVSAFLVLARLRRPSRLLKN